MVLEKVNSVAFALSVKTVPQSHLISVDFRQLSFQQIEV